MTATATSTATGKVAVTFVADPDGECLHCRGLFTLTVTRGGHGERLGTIHPVPVEPRPANVADHPAWPHHAATYRVLDHLGEVIAEDIGTVDDAVWVLTAHQGNTRA